MDSSIPRRNAPQISRCILNFFLNPLIFLYEININFVIPNLNLTHKLLYAPHLFFSSIKIRLSLTCLYFAIAQLPCYFVVKLLLEKARKGNSV